MIKVYINSSKFYFNSIGRFILFISNINFFSVCLRCVITFCEIISWNCQCSSQLFRQSSYYYAVYINYISSLLLHLLCEIICTRQTQSRYLTVSISARGKSRSRSSREESYASLTRDAIAVLRRWAGMDTSGFGWCYQWRLATRKPLAIWHMACCSVHIHCATAYLALQYVRTSISGRKLHTLHWAVHDAPAIAPVRRKMKRRKRKDGWRGKSARLEKRAISPSMLLLRDKAEDADVRAYCRHTECPWSFAISFRSLDFACD